ncbi:hypothetical protein K435DRAFT_804761 [Dendrothele bispora CBS 962.96]|uniref:Uncharacterized protein n=1 Tax=Dendrothele bispora (strain CBS 962.96) TaxID=1314807 RepID=A0A4S8LD95_DENBC|nr:hypothetical protein K435DRAFT_804761 [Dendrothele bispora CBS 962.96]
MENKKVQVQVLILSLRAKTQIIDSRLKEGDSMFRVSNDVKLFSMASIESLDYYNETPLGKLGQRVQGISPIENAANKGETYLFMNEISIGIEFMEYLAAIRDGNPVMGITSLVEVYFSVFVDDCAKKEFIDLLEPFNQY